LRRWARLPLVLVVAAGLPASVAAPAASQDYPNRPIRIVVPLAPGGMGDMMSRAFAQKVQERTGAVVVVENRAGAAGVVAADAVAKSPPDGYTIYLGFHGTQSIMPHLDKLPYDPAKDFAPIVFLTTGPNVLVVNPSLPAKSVPELVALAKSRPGGLTYASGGIGSSGHLAGEQFRLATGIEMPHVPYRGQAPANQDVLAGHVPMTFDLIGLAVNNIRDGRLRALAVTGAERSPSLPEVPTMSEAGYPEVQGGPWFAFFAPAGTPRPVIDWLNKQANEIFSDRELVKPFTSQGMTMPLGTPEALQAHVEADTRRWGEVIRKAGIRMQ
jgi:tripartite-type tricarboxylate transporter receptor subunit TctC